METKCSDGQNRKLQTKYKGHRNNLTRGQQ